MSQESLCFQRHYQDATVDSQGVLPQSPASSLWASPLHFISAVPAGEPSCPQGTCGKSYNYVGCHTEGRGALLRSSERPGMLLSPQQGTGKPPTTKNYPTQNVKSTQVPKPKFTGIRSFNRQTILQGSNCCYPRSTSELTGAPGGAQRAHIPTWTLALALTGQPPQALMSLRIQRKEVLSLKQVTSWVYHQHHWVEGGPLSQIQDPLLQAPGGAPLPRAQLLATQLHHPHVGIRRVWLKRSGREPQCCELWGTAGFSSTLTTPPGSLYHPPSLLLPQDSQALGTQGHSCWALSPHTHLSPQPRLGTGSIFQRGSGGRESKACNAGAPGTEPKS